MIRVMLVDDHGFVRSAIRQALTAPDVEVVAEAATAEEALRLAPEVRPDVLLLDIDLPGMSGLRLLRELRPRLPEAAFVMLTVEPKQTAAVTAALKRLPGVRRLQSVSGPFDMIAAVEAPSVSEMDARIDEIGAVPGVERTNSSIVLSTKFDR